MAPEQLRGEAVDGRSDIFALGVILYEITVGRRLWKGAPEQVARRILEEKIPPPTYLRRDYPPGLELIVLRALEKNPDDRYQSAEEMHRELQGFLDEEGLRSGTRRVADYLKDLFGISEGGRGRDHVHLPTSESGPIPAGEHAAGDVPQEELDFDRRAPLTVRLEPRATESTPAHLRPPLKAAESPRSSARKGHSANASDLVRNPTGESTAEAGTSQQGSKLRSGYSQGAAALSASNSSPGQDKNSSAKGLWLAFGVFLIAAVGLMVFLGTR